VEKVISQARLSFFVPERCGFEFLIGLRMADDVH
jgi:hypothetical protein